MKCNKNLAAIHAYLCGDGYVIKNPKSQKHKYYHIGFRNTNDVLLEDFQKRFLAVFGRKPYITNEGRCRIQDKKIYGELTKNDSYYSYEWKMPRLSNTYLRAWLRAFFDCESWVENRPAKSRLIGLDCCNETGILSIQKSLKHLGIDSNVRKKKNRSIWSLTICGQDDLKMFQRMIGFLHPNKKQKLVGALNSYRTYSWKIPGSKEGIITFLKEHGRLRKARGQLRLFSIKKENLTKLKKVLNKHGMTSMIFGPWKNNTGSKYYCLIVKERGEETDGKK